MIHRDIEAYAAQDAAHSRAVFSPYDTDARVAFIVVVVVHAEGRHPIVGLEHARGLRPDNSCRFMHRWTLHVIEAIDAVNHGYRVSP